MTLPFYDFFFLESKKQAAASNTDLLRRWKWLQKELTTADGNHITLGDVLVSAFILSHFNYGALKLVNSENGYVTDVLDYDDGTQYKLTLKRVSSTELILTDDWARDFVHRRSLVPQDVVGFYWDEVSDRLFFRVIRRSIR